MVIGKYKWVLPTRAWSHSGCMEAVRGSSLNLGEKNKHGIADVDGLDGLGFARAGLLEL